MAGYPASRGGAARSTAPANAAAKVGSSRGGDARGVPTLAELSGLPPLDDLYLGSDGMPAAPTPPALTPLAVATAPSAMFSDAQLVDWVMGSDPLPHLGSGLPRPPKSADSSRSSQQRSQQRSRPAGAFMSAGACAGTSRPMAGSQKKGMSKRSLDSAVLAASAYM